jgi:hypothetical protein
VLNEKFKAVENGELRIIWEKVVMDYFKVLFHHLLGGAQEVHDNVFQDKKLLHGMRVVQKL